MVLMKMAVLFKLWKGCFALYAVVDLNPWIKQPKCNRVS